MLRLIFAFIAGGLFGTGLFLSGMTDTTKVQGWLDVFGNWDPTLAFVLGGAILPMALAWHLTKSRKPLTCDYFPAPPNPQLDRRLIGGSVLFGMGWGLVGLCPGPAIASLGYGGWPHWVFLLCMLTGMIVTPKLRSALDTARPAE